MPEINGQGIRLIVDADGNVVTETTLLMQDGSVVMEKTETGYRYCVAEGR